LSTVSDTLRRLADKDEIKDVLLRYCRGVDRRDWELVRSAFFADCIDDHADFTGGRDDFITWLSASHNTAGFARSTHILGNCLIEFVSDNVAVVETYFIAKLELGADAGGHRKMLLEATNAESTKSIRIEVLGRYVDRFEKRENAWRVARRRTVFDAMRSKPVAGDGIARALNPKWTLGRRDKHDPVFLVRAEAGLQ
jgi:hypothetical protein